MPYFEGQQTIKHWRSSPAPINAGNGTSNGTFMVAPIDIDGEPFPGNLVANTFAIAMSYNWTATSVSQVFSSTFRLGLYTRSGGTLSLVNSASKTFGATAANTGNSGSFQGVRFLTLGTGDWSKAPVFNEGDRYWVAMQVLSAVTTTNMSWMNAVSVGTAFSGTMYGAGAPNATHHPFAPFRGVFNATTNAVPATIQASQVTGTGTNLSFTPWLRLDVDFRGFA